MENIHLGVVLLEGILSFLSPCILPLLPVYLTILSNSNGGERTTKSDKLLQNTLFFVLGISSTFFLLGNSVSLFSQVLVKNKSLIMLVGGLLIILMGLLYADIIQISFLQKEKRFQYEFKQMNGVTAYVLGLTFSFGWTPCIGPMLTSVLVMASGANSLVQSNLLILVYTLGFMIPFMLLALFSKKMISYLDRIKKHMGLIQKIGGAVLVITGAMMFYNGVSGLRIVNLAAKQEITQKEVTQDVETDEVDVIPAPDFTLIDQYGVTRTLSDYKGKTVFLNFWATWCPPCRQEMPHIEQLYKEYGENQEDVIILGVAFPESGRETNIDGIAKFLEEHEYTFPTVFDETELMAYNYGINAFPTTFIINTEGNLEMYVPGAMTKDMMKQIIEEGR
ncbi:MAG: cytochrome c biogenesis protein CcdA [Cellulosilyticaceae bacterium]